MQRRILKRQIANEFLLAPLSKVLLIDDDKADLEYHRQLLEGQGHEVRASSSYLEGAGLAATEDFDFVVAAQGSVGFEGKIILQRLAERERPAPALVLTRSAEMSCYLEAMQLGAIDYLEKPIHPTEMRRILRTHLQPSLASR